MKQRSGGRRSVVIFLVVSLLVLVLPSLWPGDPTEIRLTSGNRPPSWQHPLGTDYKGRDLFLRVLYGTRLSYLIGIVATAVSLLIGVPYGALAGFGSRRRDAFMMRIVDILYGLPYMLIVIILIVLTRQSVLLLFVALGMVQWLTMARVVRAEVLSLRERDFVDAARVLGIGDQRILLRHILPNVLDTMLVYATFTIPQVIIRETFLSFLGLGVPAPQSSLGTLILDGIRTISIYPWQLLFPALALLLLVFGTNKMGNYYKQRLAGSHTNVGVV